MTPAERLDTFQRFIASVEDGRTIKQACRDADIAWGSLNRWLADPEARTGDGETFASRYARARLVSAASFADRALEAAETATVGDWQVKRLQVDTLKWRAAMADPKAWGEKRSVDVAVSHRVLPPEERDRRLAELLGNATVVPSLPSGSDTPDDPDTAQVLDAS